MGLRRVSRWLSFSSMLALAAVAAPGCTAEGSPTAAGSDAITQVDQSAVKRQAIGNCWVYATTSWLEALHKGATGEEVNTSESWITYWHWFGQLAEGSPPTTIATGGWYSQAALLIDRYGLMKEGDFLPLDADSEMSFHQKTALNQVNESLKNGALKDAAKNHDRLTIRKELDRAWGLTAEQSKRMDAVFGAAVDRTFDESEEAKAAAKANLVIPASDFAARLMDPQTKQMVNGTLADAIGKGGLSIWFPRTGPFAFQEVNYPTQPAQRRQFWKRVQRALHDQVPVITSWKVDFNALTRDSHFSKDELDKRGPGPQGGHMTVMHDYQAEVPGLGLLEAGKQATREEMAAALSDDTVIQFVRVKNSWGAIRPDRWDNAIVAGYHDLEMPYLNGPIKDCLTDDKGETDTKNCPSQVTPLGDVVLPAGY